MSESTRKQLRTRLRTRRRSLSAASQRFATDEITRQLYRQTFFLKARHIGFYWPTDGEVDITGLFLDSLKTWYLPLVSDSLRPFEPQRLLFQPLRSDSSRTLNKYGILEPHYDPREIFNPIMLDVVLLPLVGFDRSGNRLGMGKGYYDRTFKMGVKTWRNPKLIGIAHSIQECRELPAQSWDIPLQAIVTEKEIIWP